MPPPMAAPIPGEPTAAPMIAPVAAPTPPPTRVPFSRVLSGCPEHPIPLANATTESAPINIDLTFTSPHLLWTRAWLVPFTRFGKEPPKRPFLKRRDRRRPRIVRFRAV